MGTCQKVCILIFVGHTFQKVYILSYCLVHMLKGMYFETSLGMSELRYIVSHRPPSGPL